MASRVGTFNDVFPGSHGFLRMRKLNGVVQKWEVLLLLLGSAGVQILCAHYFRVGLYLDLSLILVLYIGWYSGPTSAAANGTLFGLVQDAVYRTFLGLNGLSKTIAGFAASLLSRVFQLNDTGSRILLTILLSALDSGVVYLMLLLVEQEIGQRFWIDALIKAVVTGVAGGVGSRFYDHFKFPRKDFRRVGA
ncbi:MAG: rod shape-determining protein MreD [Acidobacteria bacterium]|nr:MAG: rod shape-determining protein MreD [Acidobacteriota bacterium]